MILGKLGNIFPSSGPVSPFSDAPLPTAVTGPAVKLSDAAAAPLRAEELKMLANRPGLVPHFEYCQERGLEAKEFRGLLRRALSLPPRHAEALASFITTVRSEGYSPELLAKLTRKALSFEPSPRFPPTQKDFWGEAATALPRSNHSSLMQTSKVMTLGPSALTTWRDVAAAVRAGRQTMPAELSAVLLAVVGENPDGAARDLSDASAMSMLCRGARHFREPLTLQQTRFLSRLLKQVDARSDPAMFFAIDKFPQLFSAEGIEWVESSVGDTSPVTESAQHAPRVRGVDLLGYLNVSHTPEATPQMSSRDAHRRDGANGDVLHWYALGGCKDIPEFELLPTETEREHLRDAHAFVLNTPARELAQHRGEYVPYSVADSNSVWVDANDAKFEMISGAKKFPDRVDANRLRTLPRIVEKTRKSNDDGMDVYVSVGDYGDVWSEAIMAAARTLRERADELAPEHRKLSDQYGKLLDETTFRQDITGILKEGIATYAGLFSLLTAVEVKDEGGNVIPVTELAKRIDEGNLFDSFGRSTASILGPMVTAGHVLKDGLVELKTDRQGKQRAKVRGEFKQLEKEFEASASSKSPLGIVATGKGCPIGARNLPELTGEGGYVVNPDSALNELGSEMVRLTLEAYEEAIGAL